MAAKKTTKVEKNTPVNSAQEEKLKALEHALSDLDKQFGKGAVMKLGDDDAKLNIEAISTGSMSLDLATGIGGVPRGRIVEVYGPESSGKTTLALHVIAEAQKLGGKAAFIDAEHALDPEYARNLGVDVDELLVSQPDYGEQALEITEMLVRSGAIDVVIVDSVAALVPKNEIDGAMGDATVGAQARLMSQALRKLAGVINKTNTTIIFINQLREKIGVMFGNPETTTGGRALKFFSSMRIDVRRVESIKVGDQVLGNRTRAKIVKNKVAPPFKTAEFDILYGEGISRTGELIDMGVALDVIKKSGAWLYYNGEKLGQGRDKAREALSNDPALEAELEAKIKEVLANTAIDESRILTEAAIFADKVAVDEETVRLRSHLKQMNNMLSAGGAVGRKLDFLLQEMNREANTIGSKCTDVNLARIVVDIKAELEKIREQTQNIE